MVAPAHDHFQLDHVVEPGDRERQLLAGVVAAMPDAVIVTDEHLRITEYTGAAQRIYGWTRDECLGRCLATDFTAEFPDDDATTVRQHLRDGVETTARVRALRKDGTWADLDLLATPLKDEHGALTGWLSVARDISARVASERARRVAEEETRSIITTMAEGVVMQSADGRIVRCNPAAERILGLSRRQMEGRDFLDPRWRTIRPDGSPFPGDEHPAMVALRTGQPISNVVMGVHTPAGALRWILVNAEPSRPDSRTPAPAVVTTFTDITCEHNLARQLDEKSRQLAHVLDGSDDGYWDWDIRSGRVQYSARWASMLGYRLAELEPHVATWERLVHPDDAPAVAAAVDRLLRAEIAHYQSEHRVRHKDGHWVWVLDRGRVVERAPDGRALRAAGTHTDVTARRVAEDALRDREAQLRAYFESPAFGVAVIGADDRWERVNDQLCEMLGYSRGELLPLSWLDVTHPDDRVAHVDLLRQLLGGERDHMMLEKRYVRKDGTVMWSLTTVTCHRRADGRLAARFAVLSDITPRKVAEAERAAAAQQVRDALAANQSLVAELRDALDKVKTLSGFLPICMYCKKVRDDAGYWERIEQYIAAHTDARLSHGLCPDCAQHLYDQLDRES